MLHRAAVLWWLSAGSAVFVLEERLDSVLVPVNVASCIVFAPDV